MYNSNYNNRNTNSRWENDKQNNLTKYSKDMDKLKYAEEVMEFTSKENNKKEKLTSNQMRIILSLFVNTKNELEQKEIEEELTKEELYKIKYIKVKLIYQISRTGLEEFFRNSYLGNMIDDVITRKDFYNLVDYVEALVAYQKYYFNK